MDEPATELQQALSDPPPSSCGYTLANGTYSIWPGGYQAWVELANVSGATATTFEVLLNLDGTSLQNGYQADFAAYDGGVRVTAPSWLVQQKIPKGSSYRFAFVGSGAYTSVTPYIVSVNGVKCDTTPPVIAFSATPGLVTANGSVTLNATATDNVAVWKVVFAEDGVVIGEDRTAPYSLTRNLTSAANGRRHYTATAVDPAGNPASASASVLVAIDNRFFGSAPDNAADYQDFAGHFDQVTPENASKWGFVEATRDEMNWAELDQAYAFAQANGFPFKLHTLVWGQQEPAWLAALPPEEQLEELEEWMALLAERYAGVAMIDVVNEPLHAPPSYAAALGGAGETGWDWVVKAFELARGYFPGAELLLNEYQILILDQFTDQYLQIIEILQDRGLIDGIGEQGHFLERAELPVVAGNLARLAATGLPLYITELDVNFANDARQAVRLRDLVTTFWANSSVLGITHWGHLQGSTWQPNAYLIRSDGSPRPALDWLDCARTGGEDCPVPEYVPPPRTGGEFGITLEAEDYDDAEGLIALGNTVAYTDDGDWLSFSSVVLQPEWDTLEVTYFKGNDTPSSLSIHLDSLENAPVASVELPPTGGWGTSSTLELPWLAVSGEHDVFVRFNGSFGVANLDSIAIGREAPDDGYGPNLISNDSFESGTSGWFGWGGVLTATSERSHSGAQCLKVSERNAGQGTAAVDLTSSVVPGGSYQLRYFVTIGGAPSAPVNITRKAVCTGQTDSYVWVANGTVTDGVWTEFSGVMEVPDCELTELQVYVEGPPEGVDLYVDDASIRAPLVANLVSNGDFETGTSPWFGWGGTLATTSELAHGGAQSLRVSDRSEDQGTAAITLTSAVEPGGTYQASFFVTVTGAATAPVNVTRKLGCAGETDAYTWVSSSGAVAEGVWTELSGPFAIPDECELTELTLYVEGPPAGVDLYVDDVVVSP